MRLGGQGGLGPFGNWWGLCPQSWGPVPAWQGRGWGVGTALLMRLMWQLPAWPVALRVLPCLLGGQGHASGLGRAGRTSRLAVSPRTRHGCRPHQGPRGAAAPWLTLFSLLVFS